MKKAKAWIISMRPFAIPFWLAGTAMGTAFAGGSLKHWVISSLIVTFLGLVAHFLNNWRDYVKGLDKVEEDSKPKAYTAANQILPRGILDVKDMQMAVAFCLVVALMLAGVFLRRIDQILLFICGLIASLGYTDIFKPRGLGEIALFLGWGGIGPFAYTLVKPFDYTALTLWLVIGMTGAMMYTLDQMPDVETDLARRIKNLAYYVLKAKIHPSQIVWFAVSAVMALSIGAVAIGWAPKELAYIVFTLPIWHVCGIIVDNDFDKGVLLGLVGYFLIMVVPTLALLF